MLIRHATAVELASPPTFVVKDRVGFVNDDQLSAEAAARRMRPEWTWYALVDARILGRAVWWGLPDGSAQDAITWRAAAASAAGLTDVIERLRFEWTPADGLPLDPGRLVLRPGGDDEFLAAFARVAIGSLDVATRRDIESVGVAAQAEGDLEFYLSCPGDRSWWRIAETPQGALVGFAIPSATPQSRNVGYLGVLPELRGRGFVDDLLAGITRRHAADGADRITATTDVANEPMAAAFRRAGYRVTERRIVHGPARGSTWPDVDDLPAEAGDAERGDAEGDRDDACRQHATEVRHEVRPR